MEKMKFDVRQKRARRNIKGAADWLIGENENTMLDCPEDSKEYNDAKEFLADHENLVQEVYYLATHSFFIDGCCCSEQESAPILNDIRFCGKEWLLAQVEEIVAKQGY